MPKSQKAEKNPNWKGGISKDRNAYTRAWQKAHPQFKEYQRLRHASKMGQMADYPRTDNCEICGIPEKDLKKILCYDHDHNTNKFRGWLCSRCNLLLGQIEGNLELSTKMVEYLEKHKRSGL